MNYNHPLLLCLISISPLVSAMQPYECGYLIKQEHAEETDAEKRDIYVPRSLFMALCMNAAQDSGRDKTQLYGLLQKVKSRGINTDDKDVLLTPKEFFAGLITHIKYANTYLETTSGPLLEVFIQNHRVHLGFGPNFWNPNNVSAHHHENLSEKQVAQLADEFAEMLRKIDK